MCSTWKARKGRCLDVVKSPWHVKYFVLTGYILESGFGIEAGVGCGRADVGDGHRSGCLTLLILLGRGGVRVAFGRAFGAAA